MAPSDTTEKDVTAIIRELEESFVFTIVPKRTSFFNGITLRFGVQCSPLDAPPALAFPEEYTAVDWHRGYCANTEFTLLEGTETTNPVDRATWDGMTDEAAGQACGTVQHWAVMTMNEATQECTMDFIPHVHTERNEIYGLEIDRNRVCYGFSVKASNPKTGKHNFTFCDTADLQPDAGSTSFMKKAASLPAMPLLAPTPSTTWKISFQPTSSPKVHAGVEDFPTGPADDWLVDDLSETYGDRGNGLSYGANCKFGSLNDYSDGLGNFALTQTLP